MLGCIPVAVEHDKPAIKHDRTDHGFAGAVRTSFDRLLAGMVAAGQGLEAICLYLGLTQATVLANVVRLRCPPRPTGHIAAQGSAVGRSWIPRG